MKTIWIPLLLVLLGCSKQKPVAVEETGVTQTVVMDHSESGLDKETREGLQEAGRLIWSIPKLAARVQYLENQNVMLKQQIWNKEHSGLPALGVDPFGDAQILQANEVGILKVIIVPEGGMPVTIVGQGTTADPVAAPITSTIYPEEPR